MASFFGVTLKPIPQIQRPTYSSELPPEVPPPPPLPKWPPYIKNPRLLQMVPPSVMRKMITKRRVQAKGWELKKAKLITDKIPKSRLTPEHLQPLKPNFNIQLQHNRPYISTLDELVVWAYSDTVGTPQIQRHVIVDLMNHHRCFCLQYTHPNIVFYHQDNPQYPRGAKLMEFIKCPDANFPISKADVAIKYLQDLNHETIAHDRAQALAQDMLDEACVLRLDTYHDELTPCTYVHDDLPYQVKPKSWRKGSRPHLNPNYHPDTEYVAAILAKEGCTLTSAYTSCDTYITYDFEGKSYKVKFNNWKNRGIRPHHPKPRGRPKGSKDTKPRKPRSDVKAESPKVEHSGSPKPTESQLLEQLHHRTVRRSPVIEVRPRRNSNPDQ